MILGFLPPLRKYIQLRKITPVFYNNFSDFWGGVPAFPLPGATGIVLIKHLLRFHFRIDLDSETSVKSQFRTSFMLISEVNYSITNIFRRKNLLNKIKCG